MRSCSQFLNQAGPDRANSQWVRPPAGGMPRILHAIDSRLPAAACPLFRPRGACCASPTTTPSCRRSPRSRHQPQRARLRRAVRRRRRTARELQQRRLQAIHQAEQLADRTEPSTPAHLLAASCDNDAAPTRSRRSSACRRASGRWRCAGIRGGRTRWRAPVGGGDVPVYDIAAARPSGARACCARRRARRRAASPTRAPARRRAARGRRARRRPACGT